MRKTGFALALAAMLVVPGAATAAPTKEDSKAASKECHQALKTAGSKEAFLAAGPYKNFGDCVSKEAKERAAARRAARAECKSQGLKGKAYRDCVRAESQANIAAANAKDKKRVNAARECRDEKAEDRATFDAEHGTGKNAFGKCVSAHARAKEEGEDPHSDQA